MAEHEIHFCGKQEPHLTHYWHMEPGVENRQTFMCLGWDATMLDSLRVQWHCNSCGAILNRKQKEPAPTTCSVCHTTFPDFTRLEPRDG